MKEWRSVSLPFFFGGLDVFMLQAMNIYGIYSFICCTWPGRDSGIRCEFNCARVFLRITLYAALCGSLNDSIARDTQRDR